MKYKPNLSFLLSKEAAFAGLFLLLLALPVIVLQIQKQQNATKAQAAALSGWPTTPPAEVCGNTGLLSGPATPPAGAITVPAGDNDNVNFGQANATYWFAPGVHTLGTDQFGQIIPGNNATFIGGPGAILDGQKKNQYAFTQHATGVTIKYLTIQNFGAVGSNNNEGVVNHDAGTGWTISYNTIQNNAGAGVFIGSDNTLEYNCLTSNEQYGFSSYKPEGLSNVILDHNEISFNNTYDWESKIEGCGCTGGGKFWDTDKVTISNNYVHDNHSVGLWADTNDTDFLVEGNYISNNKGVGLFYEISYNMIVRNNNFVRNALGDGPGNPGFPTGAIYLSEAGGDSRVPGRTGNIEIHNNSFTDNWSGVILWENADRFCNSPANTSGGSCTMVNPAVTTNTCVSGTINNEPYYSDCRWKTNNVQVHDNVFSINKANIPGCTGNASCGLQGLFSNWGTYPTWSPYTADKVQKAITFNQNNVFSNNQYAGDWKFMAKDQGSIISFTAWQAAPYNQDSGSTLNGLSNPTPTLGAATPTYTPTPTPDTSTVATPTPSPTFAPIPTATQVPTRTPTPTVKPTATPIPVSSGNALDANTAGIESGVGNWVAWYSTNIARSTEAAHSGSSSLKVKVTAANGWGVQLSNWPGFSVTAGTKTIRFWGRAGSGNNTKVVMRVRWYSANRSVLRTSQIVIPTLTNTWQKTEAVVTAPAGTATVHIDFTGNTKAGTTFYLDDIFITK